MTNEYWKSDTLQKVFWVILGSMAMIQIVAYLLNQVFGVGSNIRLGMGFMLLIVVGVVMFSFTLLMRAQSKEVTMSKINMFIMLVAVAALIFLLLNLNQLVPGIFEQAVFDLKSVIGLV